MLLEGGESLLDRELFRGPPLVGEEGLHGAFLVVADLRGEEEEDVGMLE